MSDSENGKGDNETTQPDVKEEDNEDQKESSESKQEEKSTNEDKKPRKTAKKEEVKDDDDEDEGSDESEEEVGLLDRPVEVSGSRERKKVERLEVNFRTQPNKAKIPEGRGEKLGECPRIEFKVQKTPVEELKALHKLLFNRPGSAHEIKRNIRKFSGFPFLDGSAEFEKKKSSLEKQKLTVLKQMCEVLDIERTGAREDIAVRIMQFLLEPKSSGKQLPVSKSRKKSSAKGGRAKRTDKEKKEKKGSAKKRKKTSDSDEEDSEKSEKDESEKEESDKEEEEEKDEEEDEDAADESDESYEEPKKKKKSKPRKKKETTVKEKKKEKNGEKSKKSEDKKTPAKAAKRKSAGSSDDSDDESSDGEPLAKKVKSPPSDDEIKQLVKKILDDADLEEITMKKVIKQVFDTYPDFDLSEKKEYIKATVKSVIS